VKDSSVDNFVSEERVTDAFVRLLCESYARTVRYGLTPKPDFVTKATQERSTDCQETVEDLLRSKFVFYSGDVESDFMHQNGRYDWDKADDWWIKVSDVNDRCPRTAASSKSMIKGKLEKLGVVCMQRKVGGVVVRGYVGMRLPRWDEDNDNGTDGA